jgi:hypothetical protein
MTNITSVPEVQSAPKPKVDLGDFIAEVSLKADRLDTAIDDLLRTLDLFDDEHVAVSVSALVADMLRDAEEVRYQVDLGDFSGQAAALETLADEVDEDEEEPASG